ncbi:MAG: hypothetical protein NTY63_03665 [Candidatus Bipolaricaulota bacterium]|nr:hypothetical protein [Candidatus Bipolaricaulota bacterium]
MNRVPVLTLWATIVARRLGYDEDEALTLGKAIAGQTAAAKGKRLGLYAGKTASEAEALREERQARGAESIEFMGRVIPCLRTDKGLRTLDDVRPADPAAVRRYLESKFGDALPASARASKALRRVSSPMNWRRPPWTSTCGSARPVRQGRRVGGSEDALTSMESTDWPPSGVGWASNALGSSR